MSELKKCNDLTLVYIYSEMPGYIRVAKCLPVFSKIFKEVHYIGCPRTDQVDTSLESQGNIHFHIFPHSMSHGGGSIGSALGFYAYIRDVLKQVKPDVVMATNEEYILPFSLGYFPRPDWLFCDLTDSLAIRISSRLRHLNFLWRALSNVAKKTVDGLIEVSNERYTRHTWLPEHSTIIFNSPHVINNIDPVSDLQGKYVFVSGSFLDGVSGIEQLLDAIEKTPDVSIVAAGRPVGEWVKECFIKHPKVRFLGNLSVQDSMSIAAGAIGIYAYYKPFIENHIYAAPNKLFDAMLLGTPLIINAECKVSQFVKEIGFGCASNYDDVEGLAKNIAFLSKPTESFKDSCNQAKSLFREKYSWSVMEDKWKTFFSNAIEK